MNTNATEDRGCQCVACRDGVKHLSDCHVHNEPAEPNGPCSCGVVKQGGEVTNQMVDAACAEIPERCVIYGVIFSTTEEPCYCDGTRPVAYDDLKPALEILHRIGGVKP